MRACVFACLSAVLACSSADTLPFGATPCAPGAQIGCACPGGVQGVQLCSENGKGYGACSCEPGSAGAGAGGNGAGGNGAGGGTCTAGATESCYDGPPSTEGVGVCVGGTRTC